MVKKSVWLFIALVSLSTTVICNCGSADDSVVIENVNAAPWMQFLGSHYWIVFLCWLAGAVIFLAGTIPKGLFETNQQYGRLFTGGNPAGRLLFILVALANGLFLFIADTSVNSEVVQTGLFMLIVILMLMSAFLSTLGALWMFIFLPKTATEETGREEKLFTTVVSYESYNVPKQQAVQKGYEFLAMAIIAGQVINLITMFKIVF